jgi:hypothetical protein
MAFNSIFRQPAEQYNIQLFVGYFEQAQWKAVLGKFPRARVMLCLYHWGRNVQKSIARCGLKFMYDRSFRKAIALAKKLPFLHPDDMIKGFKAVGSKLAELFDEEERVDYLENLRSESLVRLRSFDSKWYCTEFLGHLWKTYVRDGAAYPKHRWSVYQCVIELLPFTSNACESFHAKFNGYIPRKHPRPSVAISVLKKLEDRHRRAFVRLVLMLTVQTVHTCMI